MSRARSPLARGLGIVAIVAGALALSPVAAETVKVGVVASYSGPGAEVGRDLDRGMALYRKLHPEAFGGHTVELVKRDSRLPNGEAAKTAVQELVTRERVQLLAGFSYTPDAIASAPLATQAKTPMLLLQAATAWLPQLSPYIARLSFTMWQSGFPMGRYAAEKLQCRTAAVGYTDYPPGKDSLEAFRMAFEAAGGKITDAIPMGGAVEVPDFTPFLQRVKDARPDCLYAFIPAGNHTSSFLKTVGHLGLKDAGIKLLGPGELVMDDKLHLLDASAAGLVTMAHYSSFYDTPANAAFVAAWKKEYGEDSVPNFTAVAGYDAMALIAHLVKTLDGRIDGERVMQLIRGWRYDSPRGPILIDPETRDIVQDEHVQVLVADGGRLSIEVLDRIPQVKDPCKVHKVGRCGEAR